MMKMKTIVLVVALAACGWGLAASAAVETNDWWVGKGPLVEEFSKSCPIQRVGVLEKPWTFIHDPAMIVHKGTIFCAWYNCTKGEMEGESVIRGTWSADGGRTWAEVRLFAGDPARKVHYVPPAFGSDGRDLFLFVSKMTGPDRVFELEILKWNAATKAFALVQTVKAPFLINTNAIRLGDGRWICGGRAAAKVGDLPQTPAVLVSRTAKLDGAWDVVRIDDGKSPDGKGYWIPETALIVDGQNVTAFTRCRKETAVVHESTDGGRTWDKGHFAMLGGRSISWSKMYGGRLKDGRRYLVCNLDGARDTLVVLLSAKGERKFSKAITVIAGITPEVANYPYWLYPSAVERDGRLLVLFTAHMECAGFADVTLETELPAFVRGRLDHPMHLKHLKRFAQFSPHMQKAFDFMLRKDLRTLPVGRYEIDGDNCWAMIQQVDLRKLEPEMKIEAHRRYIDIQMPLEGCELYGTAWIRGDEPALGFDVAKDVGFMEVPVRETELRAGETAYAIFLPPHGAHAPCCSKDGTGSIRKLVIKVRRD